MQFAKTVPNALSTIAAPGYTAGAGTMSLTSAASFGTLAAGEFLRISVFAANATPSTPALLHAKVTGISGNNLTIAGTLDGTTSQNAPAGSLVACTISQGTLADIHQGVKDNNFIDVFIVGGQSNAVGSPMDGPGPAVPSGWAYAYDGPNDNIIPFVDPIPGCNGTQYNTSTGSAWASFAQTYYILTGRKALFVQSAVGGTSVAPVATTGAYFDWSPTGTLRAGLVANYNAAIACCARLGYTPVLKGLLWIQGESDASSVYSGAETVAQYKTLTSALFAYFRTNINANLPIYMWRIGPYVGNVSNPAFTQIQVAQDELADYANGIDVVYRGAAYFGARGLINSTDNIHHRQAALNEEGRMGCQHIFGSPKGVQVIPDNAQKRLRLNYDGDNWLDIILSSNGSVTIDAPSSAGGGILFNQHVTFLNGTSGTSGSTTDTDATAIINAIAGTGATVSSGQNTAIQNFVQSLKSASLWAKILSMHGYIGGTAAAHAIDWKTPAGTGAVFTAATHSANGVTGTGSTGLIAFPSAINPVAIGMNSLAAGARYYGNPGTGVLIAAYNNADSVDTLTQLASVSATQLYQDWAYNAGGGRMFVNVPDTSGFHVASRTGSNVQAYYRNGAAVSPAGGTATGAGGTGSTRAFTVGLATTAVTVEFDFVSTGLSSADAFALNSAVAALQTALGR